MMRELEQRLATLEGCEAAIVLSSGMAACASTMLALLRPGDHLVASTWLSEQTKVFLEQELALLGIEATLIDPTETRAWRKAIRRNTRVLFCESLANRSIRVVDLRPARMLAQEHGIALVVDASLASPVVMRPVDHGADVVVHTAMGLLSGHDDVVAGVVCSTSAVVDEVRAKMLAWGQSADAHASGLLSRGLTTLRVRIDRQSASALRIAQWAHSCVSTAQLATNRTTIGAVHYPALSSHVDFETAQRTLHGGGVVIGIALHGDDDAGARLCQQLKHFTASTSVGDVVSHASCVSDGSVRLSVGLEDPDALIADLAHALEA